MSYNTLDMLKSYISTWTILNRNKMQQQKDFYNFEAISVCDTAGK